MTDVTTDDHLRGPGETLDDRDRSDLEAIAQSAGTIVDEQEPDDGDRLVTEEYDLRDTEEYDGGW